MYQSLVAIAIEYIRVHSASTMYLYKIYICYIANLFKVYKRHIDASKLAIV